MSEHAQYEIRRHAEAIYDLIEDDLKRVGVSREDLV
jgi:thymidylate synthase ThyX